MNFFDSWVEDMLARRDQHRPPSSGEWSEEDKRLYIRFERCINYACLVYYRLTREASNEG